MRAPHIRQQGAILGWRGFTLIELLIVVAIIAILAAIALPNFIEAQVRSKVARVKNDLRTVALGIEAYAVDNNQYPDAFLSALERNFNCRLKQITTPIAYVGELPVDVFRIKAHNYPYQKDQLTTFDYVDRATSVFEEGGIRSFANFATSAAYVAYFDGNGDTRWSMYSPGPRFQLYPYDAKTWGPNPIFAPPRQKILETYDATNGTISPGAIWRTNVATH